MAPQRRHWVAAHFGTEAVSTMFRRPRRLRAGRPRHRRKGGYSRQQEVDRSDVYQATRHRRPLSPHCPAHPVDGTCGRHPSTGKGRRARGDLSSSRKQFNSNGNELATQPRPPLWFRLPAAVTMRPFPVEFSASANQTIGRVDQFNRRSEFLSLCFRKVDGLIWILK